MAIHGGSFSIGDGTRRLEFGCMMSINPDAHSIPELDHMHWGVEMTRKGGVPGDRILNAMTLPEITRYLRHKRRSLTRAA
ncbi:DNA polymerase (family 10) [Bradyrhizobium sp. Gha]|nr:DNA polymerase (family 10) [Bradyrhizobium sp. Gha]